MFRRALLVAVVLVCALAALAACGGEDEGTQPETGGAPTVPGTTATAAPEEGSPAAEGDVVQVTLDDFSIDMPATLPAGTVTFEVTNAGNAQHNFEVEGQGIEEAFDTNLGPGETRTMTVDLEPGEYEVYCPVGNHADRGMRLMVTVEA